MFLPIVGVSTYSPLFKGFYYFNNCNDGGSVDKAKAPSASIKRFSHSKCTGVRGLSPYTAAEKTTKDIAIRFMVS